MPTTATETTVTVQADELKAALALVGGSTKDPMSGTHQVLVEVQDDHLIVTGATFYSLARTEVAATVEGEPPKLPLSVDHTRLSGVAGACSGEVTGIWGSNNLKLSAGATTATLGAFQEAHPREWKPTDPLAAVEIDELRLALGRVWHDVAPASDHRRHLTGVAFSFTKEGVLALSASNGVSAARTVLPTTQLPLTGIPVYDCIVPIGPLKEAMRALALVGGTAQIEGNEGQLVFQTPLLRWAIRLLDGRFPDIAALRLEEEEIVFWVEVDKGDLIESLRLARLFDSKTKDNTLDVVRFTAGGEGMGIATTTAEYGSLSRDIDAQCKNDDIFAFKVAGAHILAAAEAVTGDRVWMGFTDPGRPFLVLGENPETDFQLVSPCV